MLDPKKVRGMSVKTIIAGLIFIGMITYGFYWLFLEVVNLI